MDESVNPNSGPFHLPPFDPNQSDILKRPDIRRATFDDGLPIICQAVSTLLYDHVIVTAQAIGYLHKRIQLVCAFQHVIFGPDSDIPASDQIGHDFRLCEQLTAPLREYLKTAWQFDQRPNKNDTYKKNRRLCQKFDAHANGMRKTLLNLPAGKVPADMEELLPPLKLHIDPVKSFRDQSIPLTFTLASLNTTLDGQIEIGQAFHYYCSNLGLGNTATALITTPITLNGFDGLRITHQALAEKTALAPFMPQPTA